MKQKTLKTIVLIGLLFWVLGVSAARARTFTVSKTADTYDGTCDADCSLREAIYEANLRGGGTINFADALAGQTITLVQQLPIATSGGILTINGLMTGGGITVSGGDGTTNDNRVFEIYSNTIAVINNLTIRNGRSVGGGGIFNGGTLTLINSTVSNNFADTYGGAGIYNFSGTLTLINSTVSNNPASGSNGGGILNSSSGTLTLTNSTVSNNYGSRGGGIFNYGTATLTNSTVSNNSGGGIFGVSGTINLNNTIIANSSFFNDCFINDGIFNASYSLIEDGSCGVNNGANGNLTGDPNLGPLQNNGGATQTHRLLPYSLAIDKGKNFAVDANNNPVNTDQRGFTRPFDQPDAQYPNASGGDGADIGAFEAQLNDTQVPVEASGFVLITPASATPGTAFSFTVRATDSYGNTATAYSGTVRFTSTDPNAALPANATLTNGAGTFSATLNSYGLQTVTATDTATTAIRGTSNQITVQPANNSTGIVVTRADDRSTACKANDCSLREAIAAANSLPSSDTIGFAAALAGQTITLTNNAQLEIYNKGALTINGLTTGGGITVSGGNGATNTNRVFFTEFATVTINNLTIRNGRSIGSGGGAIYSNQSNITLNNSTVSNNSAGSGSGGAIYNFYNGTLTLNNSTVNSNTAEYGGGILSNYGAVTLNNSTVSGNSAGTFGGGIGNLYGTLALNSSTVSNNSASRSGGGILNTNGGTTNLNNTIIANSTGGDCSNSGGTVNASYSLIEDNLACVNGTNSNNLAGDPNLGALANNNGTTQTHALLAGSIAIDKGNSTLTTDQRGAVRPVDAPNSPNGAGNLADIGAFEVQFVSPFRLTVDTTADDANLSACTDAAPNDCSLRGAIATANAMETDDAISFAAALAGQTITLAGSELTIGNNGALTINGLTTGGGITVSGGNGTTNTNRVFFTEFATVTINNLTIRNGRSIGSGGGAIYSNQSNITLNNSTVSNNSAGSGSGGAIYRFGNGTLTLNNSTVSNNSVESGNGGAIYSLGNGTLTLNNSTVSGNSVFFGGGGGGIYNQFGTLTLNNSTVSNNLAQDGGGLYSTNSTVSLYNTIIANSIFGSDCSITGGGSLNASYSLVEDGSCINNTTINLIGDPNLGPLQNNGGATQTHALLAGSIAIDKGNSALSTDQRGFARPYDNPAIANAAGGNGADIGAFEVQAPPTAAGVTISGRVTLPQDLGLTNALVTLTDMRGETRTVRTGKFGSFRFAEVATGETYILSVQAKRYQYAPQIITANEDLTEINFTALY